VQRERLPIRFRLDGRPLSGETLCLDADARVLVLTSCSAELGIELRSAELGIELRSAYLGGERRGELLVAESAVLGAGPAEFLTRYLDDEAEAHTHERRRLLYDHLGRLQDLAREGGWDLAFEGLDAAAAQLDPHAPVS
jgi:hypothetical protein